MNVSEIMLDNMAMLDAAASNQASISFNYSIIIISIFAIFGSASVVISMLRARMLNEVIHAKQPHYTLLTHLQSSFSFLICHCIFKVLYGLLTFQLVNGTLFSTYLVKNFLL